MLDDNNEAGCRSLTILKRLLTKRNPRSNKALGRYSSNIMNRNSKDSPVTAMDNCHILQELKNLFDSGIPSTFNIELIKGELIRYKIALKEQNELNASDALDTLVRHIKDVNEAKSSAARGISGRAAMSFPDLEILEIYNEIVHDVQIKQPEIESKEADDQSNEDRDLKNS